MDKKIKDPKETTDLRGGYIKASDNKKKEQLKNYKHVVSDPENMNPNQSFEFKTDFNNILLEDIDSEKVLERNFELKNTNEEEIKKRKQELEDLFKNTNEKEEEKKEEKSKNNKNTTPKKKIKEEKKVDTKSEVYGDDDTDSMCSISTNYTESTNKSSGQYDDEDQEDKSENKKSEKKEYDKPKKEEKEKNVEKPKDDNKKHNSKEENKVVNRYRIYPNGGMPNGVDIINITVDPRFGITYNYDYSKNQKALRKMIAEQAKEKQRDFGGLLTWYYPNYYYYNLTYPYLLYNPIYPSKTENSKDEQKNKLLTYNLTYPYLYNPIYNPIYPSKTENSKDEQKNKLLTYNLTYPYLLYNPIYVPYNNLYENMAKQIKNNAQGLKNSRSDDKCKGRS